jgi:Sterol-sensing domain of SREBP cleavage-activation
MFNLVRPTPFLFRKTDRYLRQSSTIKVDAVTKTSVTLPVKERIAMGLSHAGTSNTLKVVSYNTILGIIAVLSVGAIRQFCAFAIVVLVAHWFLAHTFFMAVLSIDIQRLEASPALSLFFFLQCWPC